jgi:hypothetical protein
MLTGEVVQGDLDDGGFEGHVNNVFASQNRRANVIVSTTRPVQVDGDDREAEIQGNFHFPSHELAKVLGVFAD